MKIKKIFLGIIVLVIGLGLQGLSLKAEDVLEIQDVTEVFLEPDSYEDELALLPDAEGVIELAPEIIVYSDKYDNIMNKTLTEEEVLEALGALSMSEIAVERGLAVYISGSKGIKKDIIISALSDPDEAVRGEAIFYLSELFSGSFAQK